MLDRIAGQAVCLPVLTAVAIVLARRRRSWRPIVIALLAEVGFLGGVGTLKVLLGRGASSTGDTRFFEACLLEMGTLGISFPPLGARRGGGAAQRRGARPGGCVGSGRSGAAVRSGTRAGWSDERVTRVPSTRTPSGPSPRRRLSSVPAGVVSTRRR